MFLLYANTEIQLICMEYVLEYGIKDIVVLWLTRMSERRNMNNVEVEDEENDDLHVYFSSAGIP